MNDRTVRRLTALEQSASTARVLNLVAPHRKFPDDASLTEQPFFQHRLLNGSIIVKHRVRPHELELFAKVRPSATKLLAPIDGSDLKLGARSLMVGQRDFDRMAETVFGDALKPGKPDRVLLDLIDELPSLDPFLLREHLKRHGYNPARNFFSISEADLARMYDFVRGEVTDLVALSISDGASATTHASKLVDKLLSDSPEAGFEPLKAVLKLSDQEYSDGVFAWRGFLYYKWVLNDLMPQLGGVQTQLATLQPRGPKDPEAAQYLPGARQRLQLEIAGGCAKVAGLLQTYDSAYKALTKDSDPVTFRNFLLAAPQMFMSLGEQLGAIQHVVSFWRYRFPEGRPALVAADELMDLFLDFEDSLAVSAADAPLALAS
ncbi:MAG TPA: hypothetical protein VIO94_16265 [Phenylobacterium sp.]